MKIYRATYTLYVAAEDELHAKFAAHDADLGCTEWEIDEVTDIAEVELGWLDSTPWAETYEQQDMLEGVTIRQLLER